MKVGDRVIVRRNDGVDHWIFAVVHDPATNRVKVDHPGHREHEQVLLVPPDDIRTRADLAALIEKVKPILAKAHPQHGLAERDIKALGELDGFWLSWVTPADGRLTESQSRNLVNQRIGLHRLVIPHYQTVMKQLS